MPNRRDSNNAVQEELDAIKRLLVLQLITSGVQATDVAKALRVSKNAIRRMVPEKYKRVALRQVKR